MDSSILDDIKDLLDIHPSNTGFNSKIVLHINSAFRVLNQLGVGPVNGFRIQDNTAVWDTYFDNDLVLDDVKTFIFYRVKLAFDPPATSFAIAALQEEIREAVFRIEVAVSDKRWTAPIPKPNDPPEVEEPDWADYETVDGGVIGG